MVSGKVTTWETEVIAPSGIVSNPGDTPGEMSIGDCSEPRSHLLQRRHEQELSEMRAIENEQTA